MLNGDSHSPAPSEPAQPGRLHSWASMAKSLMDVRALVALVFGALIALGGSVVEVSRLPDVVARIGERLASVEGRVASLQSQDDVHSMMIERHGLRVTIVSDDVEELTEVVQGALLQLERLDERTQRGRAQ